MGWQITEVGVLITYPADMPGGVHSLMVRNLLQRVQTEVTERGEKVDEEGEVTNAGLGRWERCAKV